MNRIDRKFQQLRRKNKKVFIAFVTAGDPTLKTTEKLVFEFEHAGVDIVELGVPFSDPMADGPTIQAASQRALDGGVTVKKILQAVKNIRVKSQIPLVLMTYYNPVFHFGLEKFFRAAGQVGVDGIIVPDLPCEEAVSLMKAARKNRVATIFFLSPTTTKKRMKNIVRDSGGFIYYLSLTGVTGVRKGLPEGLLVHVRQAKRYAKKPICVGFGISTPAQVKSVARVADGVIVGSAIVNEIKKNLGKRNLVKNVSRFVRRLTNNV
ncbi:MAG TPA: tryptophan synthase subunit alpha [Candidatus Omnitrophota bacterium]|nr:tryptophan synthase subunit alpha [Candidatus Omnitrophota bacterium]HPD85049.1 tryptophan synthase subunit alpha [Candidatus Omnitrophota bacterium]HRZ03907.1 tryptophan synthase subunit alpha [Candidatus Omnitrophota bacterium]